MFSTISFQNAISQIWFQKMSFYQLSFYQLSFRRMLFHQIIISLNVYKSRRLPSWVDEVKFDEIAWQAKESNCFWAFMTDFSLYSWRSHQLSRMFFQSEGAKTFCQLDTLPNSFPFPQFCFKFLIQPTVFYRV